MCGIAGEINYEAKTDLGVFEKIRDSLKRRGPDQDGIYRKGAATLIHTRLAVIDPEGGMQPMTETIGGREYCIVYNGELYNTDELRDKLKARGYRFNTSCDTEVVLKAYIEWNDKCPEHFNGIYAFAVYDDYFGNLFIARDRMGVKPFFYSIKQGIFIFASEIKALLLHPSVKPVIDENGIAEIMLIGPGRTPGCGVFRDIFELKPGCCGYYSKSGLSLRKYWSLEGAEHSDSFTSTIEKTRELVIDSIRRQLISDVPLCTFMSGGLDSSIISASAQSKYSGEGKKLSTFSVDYLENEKHFKRSLFQPEADSEYIKQMQAFLDSEHRNILLDNSALANALYAAVDARDLPGLSDVDSSLLLFCEKVKEHATVALSGECADEIFGGYPWFTNGSLTNSVEFPWARSTLYRASFLNEEWREKINAQEYVTTRYTDCVKQTPMPEKSNDDERRIREMTWLNINWFMQTLLDRKDRMSMYSGLEVRVPFCDHRIVEYIYNVPPEFKFYMGREKGLLRKAMEGLLPEEVLWRKKSPYPKTHNPFYMQLLAARLRLIIDDATSPLHMIVNKQALIDLLQGENNTPWYGQLMTKPQTAAYFIQLEYWLKKYAVKII